MRTAKDILSAAALLLLDEDYTHWTMAELCTWLNLGLDAICLQKPTANAVTANINLAEGTLQSLPVGFTSMLRPVRNIRGPNASRIERKRITVTDGDVLSAVSPSWDDPLSVPYAEQVKHVIYDEANPKSFYVYPGNNGTGIMEAVMSAIPTKVQASGDPEEPSSYGQPLALDETYHDALLDYVMYRAYSKDMQQAGNAQRAALHYQQFANALGIKVKAETYFSLNAKARLPQSASGLDQGG